MRRLDVYDTVYSKLISASADTPHSRGVMNGTCSDVHRGLFYDIATGSSTTLGKPIKGWHYEEWDWTWNAKKYNFIKKHIDKMIADDPDIVRTAAFRRDWLRDWAIEDFALIYHFSPGINTINELPRPLNEYTTLLAIDLGYTASTTFNVVGWHDNDKTLYVIESRKYAGFTSADAADIANAMFKVYHPIQIVIDDGGGGLMVAEGMKERYPNLPWKSAEKVGKRSAIEFMNSDFKLGRIKLLPNTVPLQEEYKVLIWDEIQKRNGKYEADSRFSKDCCDGTLYAYRHAKHYYATEPIAPPPQKGTQAAMDALIEKEIEIATKDHSDMLRRMYNPNQGHQSFDNIDGLRNMMTFNVNRIKKQW